MLHHGVCSSIILFMENLQLGNQEIVTNEFGAIQINNVIILHHVGNEVYLYTYRYFNTTEMIYN